jgi:Protein of unknown function (DUF4231)
MSAATANPAGSDPIMDRLDNQIEWYDQKSSHCQRYYKRIKLTEIIAAALIPFVVGAHIPYAAWVAGGLGVLITILEGVLQLYQYQQIWVAYRATAEAMKHEKFIYLAQGGAYATASDPHALLAERVEALGSQENSKWASVVQQEQKVKAAT